MTHEQKKGHYLVFAFIILFSNSYSAPSTLNLYPSVFFFAPLDLIPPFVLAFSRSEHDLCHAAYVFERRGLVTHVKRLYVVDSSAPVGKSKSGTEHDLVARPHWKLMVHNNALLPITD
ncbi:hypothetical protein BYT27DRAFT_6955321 [Phlegmacium glaucopus]|nr:hypothetical protein BYT27DRAFT_6955321 [Phlegmacium glaucopus]